MTASKTSSVGAEPDFLLMREVGIYKRRTSRDLNEPCGARTSDWTRLELTYEGVIKRRPRSALWFSTALSSWHSTGSHSPRRCKAACFIRCMWLIYEPLAAPEAEQKKHVLKNNRASAIPTPLRQQSRLFVFCFHWKHLRWIRAPLWRTTSGSKLFFLFFFERAESRGAWWKWARQPLPRCQRRPGCLASHLHLVGKSTN